MRPSHLDTAYNGFSEHLTDAQLVTLAEAFGGTRVYLPVRISPDHRLVAALGAETAEVLVDALGGATLRVPVARELRARHYRSQGMSIAQVARQLGMTETGVGRMLKRMEVYHAGKKDELADNPDPTP